MKYCVGLINFFDNELKQFIVEADNWQQALIKAEQSKAPDDLVCDEQVDLINSFESIEDGQEMYFDQDQMFSVIELN
ncbi:MAG: hypothetical protein R3309_04150 [Reinekea sp.]|nr:hypothetical protein [Reinekea sp.]